MLTVSPIVVYSSRCAEPMFPAITGPLFSPIPILNSSLTPRSLIHSLNAGQPNGEHLAGGGQGAVGVVGLLDRRAEHRHRSRRPMKEIRVPLCSITAAVISSW